MGLVKDDRTVGRFEAKLAVGDFHEELGSSCWLWTGTSSRGYGRFFVTGYKSNRAYRWSYEYHKADVPEGLELDHLCRVRNCVNPDHLEPVTREVNMLRRRVTHCKWGHPLTADNLYERRRGNHVARDCKVCIRQRSRGGFTPAQREQMRWVP